jgi:hypothetical protein
VFVRKELMVLCPSNEAGGYDNLVLTAVDIDAVLNFTVRGWMLEAILNAAAAGRPSGDRTLAGRAARNWELKPCPVA